MTPTELRELADQIEKKNAVTHVERNIVGVTNYLFDQLEETERQEMEFTQKVATADLIIKNIWKGAALNLAYKRMMLQAPEIAKDQTIVLELGK